MKTFSSIQKNLWELSNYKHFLLKYCPTLFNEVAGIGVLFLFQIVVLFFTVLSLFIVFLPNWWYLGFGITFVLGFGYYKWIKLTTSFFHRHLKWAAFILISLVQALFSIILSIPLFFYLFDNQISYQLMLLKGRVEFGFWDKIQLEPLGLYLSWFYESEGNIILTFCIAVFIMVLFIFVAPYFLIFNNRKSLYHFFLTTYESKIYK